MYDDPYYYDDYLDPWPEPALPEGTREERCDLCRGDGFVALDTLFPERVVGCTKCGCEGTVRLTREQFAEKLDALAGLLGVESDEHIVLQRIGELGFKIDCPRCDDGFNDSLVEEEHQLGIRDSCYHCQEKGKVPYPIALVSVKAVEDHLTPDAIPF